MNLLVDLLSSLDIDRLFLTSDKAIEHRTFANVIRISDRHLGILSMIFRPRIIDVRANPFERCRDVRSVIYDHRGRHRWSISVNAKILTRISFALSIFVILFSKALVRRDCQIDNVFVFPFT